jgi:hypothetical protein
VEFLIINIIGGAICAAIASSKGRSGIGWFFIGFLIPLIGLIIILVLGDEREQDRQRAHARTERRRLQEQLRQERMKNEAFRRHAAGRMDAHDRVLGVSTRASPELIGAGSPEPQSHLGAGASDTLPPPPGHTPARVAWFYLRGDKQQGPVEQDRLASAFRTGRLPLTTLVWCDGMGDWQPASTVAAFNGSA